MIMRRITAGETKMGRRIFNFWDFLFLWTFPFAAMGFVLLASDNMIGLVIVMVWVAFLVCVIIPKSMEQKS